MCDGSSGDWSVKSYSSLAASVGQQVVFKYTAYHDVWKMASQAAWESCSFTGATQVGGQGAGGGSGSHPNQVSVAVTENSWFACSIGSHCANGQKLAVLTSPTPAPTPAPTAQPTSSPVGTATTTTPSLSASANSAATASQPRVVGQVAMRGLSVAEFQSSPGLAAGMKAALAASASTPGAVVAASAVTLTVSSLRRSGTGCRIDFSIQCTAGSSATSVAAALDAKLKAQGGATFVSDFQTQASAAGAPASLTTSRQLTVTASAAPARASAEGDGGGSSLVSLLLMIGGGALGLGLVVAAGLYCYYSHEGSGKVSPRFDSPLPPGFKKPPSMGNEDLSKGGGKKGTKKEKNTVGVPMGNEPLKAKRKKMPRP